MTMILNLQEIYSENQRNKIDIKLLRQACFQRTQKDRISELKWPTSERIAEIFQSISP